MMLENVLVAKDSLARASWNKSLPVPIRELEIITVHENQDGVADTFLRIKHGIKGQETTAIFSANHFEKFDENHPQIAKIREYNALYAEGKLKEKEVVTVKIEI